MLQLDCNRLGVNSTDLPLAARASLADFAGGQLTFSGRNPPEKQLACLIGHT